MKRLMDWVDTIDFSLWEAFLIISTVLSLLFIPDMIKGWKYYKKNKREIHRKINAKVQEYRRK